MLIKQIWAHNQRIMTVLFVQKKRFQIFYFHWNNRSKQSDVKQLYISQDVNYPNSLPDVRTSQKTSAESVFFP